MSEGQSGAGAARIDFDSAMRDPSAAFISPEAVLHAPGLSRRQRIEILRQWAYDQRELTVAEEESMGGGEPSHLRSVLEVLRKLEGPQDAETSPPTKAGGG